MQAARNKVDNDNGGNERIRVISGGSESPHARRLDLPSRMSDFSYSDIKENEPKKMNFSFSHELLEGISRSIG